MLYSDIQAQLNALPATYLRQGTPFTWVQTSKAAALFRYTNASDGITAQVQSFTNATGVWLDCWGKLLGIARNPDEKDDDYRPRITATLIGGHVTPVAIELYVELAYGITATVTEDFANVSWQIELGSPMTPSQFNSFIANLKFVRPAGVPIGANVNSKGGMYTGSVNYEGAPRTTGAYLKTPAQSYSIDLVAYTPNAKPLLPTVFMSDPTLNPGL